MVTGDIERQWHDYLAAYGAVEADERERLLGLSVAGDVVFTNPGGQGRTRAGLIAHIEAFQAKMPGAYFRTQKVFVREEELLAVWAMHKADGSQAATGYNFVRLDVAGKFSYMAGFF